MLSGNKYKELKEKGAITLSKNGDKIIATLSNYDANTGEKKDDSVLEINIEALNNERAELISKIEDIDQEIADINSLE